MYKFDITFKLVISTQQYQSGFGDNFQFGRGLQKSQKLQKRQR